VTRSLSGRWRPFVAAVALLCSLGLPRGADAQSASDELGTWLNVQGTNHISDRWTVFTEAQLRLYELASDPEQALLRVAPQFNLNPTAQVGFGYSYDWKWSFDDGDGPGEPDQTESRLHEQLTLRQSWGATALEHRYRVEQRWVIQDGATSYSNRVRYRFQATLPLTGPLDRAGTVFLNAFDEIFVDVGGTLSFNQNRLSVMAGYRLGNHTDVQIGYLYQSRPTANYQRLQVFFSYGNPFHRFFERRF
jgi:hypothetical protein